VDTVASRQDILHRVSIHPDLHHRWLDALGDFSTTLRLQKGYIPTTIIRFAKEHAYINKDQELVLSTSVNGEPIEMLFPKGTWRWKKDGVQAGKWGGIST
jgi:hypothetical protein